MVHCFYNVHIIVALTESVNEIIKCDSISE